jgi:hypothetical protein
MGLRASSARRAGRGVSIEGARRWRNPADRRAGHRLLITLIIIVVIIICM